MSDKFTSIRNSFTKIVKEKGWRIVSEKDLDQGTQIIVTNGTTKLPVNIYNTGKIVVQGKDSEMKIILTDWVNLVQAGLRSEPSRGTAQRNQVARNSVPFDKISNTHHTSQILPGEVESIEIAPNQEPMTRIGVDESGKGDVFGPLVVAGVVLSPEMEPVLARQGVRDSKTLSSKQILQLAQRIRDACMVEVLMLQPHDYNIAYEHHGRNLNRLLAWAHAQVIIRLSQRGEVRKAISDQFGNESLLVEALAAEECQIALEQRHRAESDLAVASASIIARAEFIVAMQEHSQQTGLRIPFGASASEVKEVGKIIYRRWGWEGLERLAKMHFKTIQEIINEVDK